jgi:hypothetical protein
VSFLVQFFARSNALFSTLLFESIAAARPVQREDADRDDDHPKERRDTAGENHEAIDRARGVGRHISWKV